MSDTQTPASGDPGSAANVPAATDAGQTPRPAAPAAPSGQQQVPAGDPAKDYTALETKLGEQGNELGQYREFFKNVSPLLTKLDSQPELIQAILDDKIDPKLVTAVLAGKVKIEEAQQVADAHQQVKKEMGKEYQQADPAEIERRVLEKATELVDGKIDEKFKSADQMREFEGNVQTFISNTPDFPQFANKISDWLDKHPDQDDIEVAYNAVKGIELSKDNAKKTDAQIAEEAKQAALNASGAPAPSGGKITPKKSAADELIGNTSNPNSFRF